MRDLRFGAEDHIVMFIAPCGTCRTQPNLVLRHPPRTRNRTPNSTSAPKPEVPTAELTSRQRGKNNGRYTHPCGNGAPRKEILATVEPRCRRSTKSSQDKNGSTHSTCCDLLGPRSNPSQKSKKVRRIITVHYKHRVNIGLHNTRVL